MIARHFSVWNKDDLIPPATQMEQSSKPATEVAGYYIAPIKGAVKVK
ncbi:MAG: hypothetical protein K0B81_09520 [Candidatus Cloacimonetes bacterium]|nr:hypothetical protein [Candidatus Cloacimonadota bacterium]